MPVLHKAQRDPGLVRLACGARLRLLSPADAPGLAREIRACGAAPDALPPLRPDDLVEVRVAPSGGASLRPLPARVAVALGRSMRFDRLSAEDLTIVPGVGARLSGRIIVWTEALRERGERLDPCRIEEVRGVGPVLGGRIHRLLLPGLLCSKPHDLDRRDGP